MRVRSSRCLHFAFVIALAALAACGDDNTAPQSDASADAGDATPGDALLDAADDASSDADADADADNAGEPDAETPDADANDVTDTVDDAAAETGDATDTDTEDDAADTDDDAADTDDDAADTDDETGDALADTGDAATDSADDAEVDADVDNADASSDVRDASDADADGADASDAPDVPADVTPDSPADTATDGDADAEPDAPDAVDDPDVGADAPDSPDTGPACGDLELPLASIRGTEGIAFAADGTFFFSQSRGVGIWTADAGALSSWITLPSASTVWGVVFRESDRQLFVASPSDGGVIYRIDTTAFPSAAERWVSSAGSPNGIALRDDGTVYYSDFGGGSVYRVAEDGTPSRVTGLLINQPNGLYFDDDGTLLVLSYSTGTIFRLTLDANGDEVGRVVEASLPYALDGITRDDLGNYYVSDNGSGRVVRLDENLENPTVVATGVSAAANLVFGRGPVNCNALYAASSGNLGRVEVDGRFRE